MSRIIKVIARNLILAGAVGILCFSGTVNWEIWDGRIFRTGLAVSFVIVLVYLFVIINAYIIRNPGSKIKNTNEAHLAFLQSGSSIARKSLMQESRLRNITEDLEILTRSSFSKILYSYGKYEEVKILLNREINKSLILIANRMITVEQGKVKEEKAKKEIMAEIKNILDINEELLSQGNKLVFSLILENGEEEKNLEEMIKRIKRHKQKIPKFSKY